MVEIRNSSKCDIIRYIASSLVLGFSVFITSYAIFHGITNFWKNIPGAVAFTLYIVCMTLLGIVEGLQISLVELKRQHPDSYKHSHGRAYLLGQLANRSDNVERFLMGRQVVVVLIVFFIAKLTTITLSNPLTDFVFPVPHWLYASLFETGFLTCIMVVIIAQLMPQIVAAKFPVHFLNFRIMYFAYYTCTAIEATGLTHACWLLSHLLGKVTGMKDEDSLFQINDPAYLKTPTSNHSMPLDYSLINTISEPTNGKMKGEVSLFQVESLLDQSKNINTNTVDNSILGKLHDLVKTLDSEVSVDKQAIIRYYLDSHPERFHTFPSVIGNKVYPPPQEVADHFESIGEKIPGFLRDISDPGHIPPHIVACELLIYIAELESTIKDLKIEYSSDQDDKTIAVAV